MVIFKEFKLTEKAITKISGFTNSGVPLDLSIFIDKSKGSYLNDAKKYFLNSFEHTEFTPMAILGRLNADTNIYGTGKWVISPRTNPNKIYVKSTGKFNTNCYLVFE